MSVKKHPCAKFLNFFLYWRNSHFLFNEYFTEAAVNCPLFTGPDSKAAYKETMLGVLKSTKQRCRNKFKKIPNHDLERRVEKAIEDISALLEPEASNDGSEADVEDEDNDSSDYEEDENFN